MRRCKRRGKRIARRDPGEQELLSFDPDSAVEVAGLAGIALLRRLPGIEASLGFAAQV
jgi:hypothetical protein